MPLPDRSTLASLGGAMKNFAPVEDAETDLDASFDNRTRNDVAAGTRMVDLCYASFTGHATTPVLVGHRASWVEETLPVPTHVSTGRYRLTWPATVKDELTDLAEELGGGVLHTVNLAGGKANAQATTFVHTQVVRQSANVLDVYVFDAAGTLIDSVGTLFEVWGA